MTDFDISASLEDDGRIEAYGQIAADPTEFIGTVATRTMNTVRDGLLADFSQEPPAIGRKVTFTSAQQRKKVFAARLHGARSHAVSQGWKVEIIPEPFVSTIVLSNPAPETIYVVGVRQQKWHKDTGWYYAPDLADKWGVILVKQGNEDLSQAWALVKGKPSVTR